MPTKVDKKSSKRYPLINLKKSTTRPQSKLPKEGLDPPKKRSGCKKTGSFTHAKVTIIEVSLFLTWILRLKSSCKKT
jgi:hypothetical protein